MKQFVVKINAQQPAGKAHRENDSKTRARDQTPGKNLPLTFARMTSPSHVSFESLASG